MKLRKVKVIGAGGVGSWLAYHLYEYYKINQFVENVEFHFSDDDTVDIDNLKYQKFDENDVMDPKVEAIENKYGFKGHKERVTTKEQLKGFDLVICAADNTLARELFFNYVFTNNVDWIDLRSEGRMCLTYSKSKFNTLEKMLKTLPKDRTKTSSCQMAFEKEAGIIQGGNRIIASIGSQMILNWYRNESNIHEFRGFF